MSARFWGVAAVLAAWAAIVARRRSESRTRGSADAPAHAGADDEINREELERAEREARDLQTDVRGRPLDDVVGDDWGPGTPKPPYL